MFPSFPVDPPVSAGAGAGGQGTVNCESIDETVIGQTLALGEFTLRWQYSGAPSLSPGETGIELLDTAPAVALVAAVEGLGLGYLPSNDGPFLVVIDAPVGASYNRPLVSSTELIVVAGISGGSDPASGNHSRAFEFPVF